MPMKTIKEVARQAGVSSATVSHVVNNTRFVSDEVRSRVLEAMRELGYQPNALARSLRSGKSRILGLIVPDSANPFFAEVARAIDAEAIALGYNVILCNTEDNPLKEQVYLDLLSQRRVDGVILLSEAAQTDMLRTLQRQDIRLVGAVHETAGVSMDTVLIDGQAGGRMAVRHLLDLGHRRIACLLGPAERSSSQQRLAGYRAALEESGIPYAAELVRPGNYHPDTAHALALTWLHSAHPPSAIFACNDLMALGALRAAAEIGLSVPRDLSVVGFDDIELVSYTVPALTTVAQPLRLLAQEAVSMMMDRLQGSQLPLRHVLLPPRLAIRGTSGPARG